MCSSGSRLPLVWYGLLLTSVFSSFHVSSRQQPQSEGPLLPVLISSWDKRDATHEDPEYLLGIKRFRRLYCNVGIGFHIQISPNGQITGVHNENQYTLLEISPVSRGVVTLFGVRSGLFIAMTNRGKLYGSIIDNVGFCPHCFKAEGQRGAACQRVQHSLHMTVSWLFSSVRDHHKDECNFKEKLLVNNYNTYESAVYPGMYIGIGKTGKIKKGNRVTPTMTMTHFLPRI